MPGFETQSLPPTEVATQGGGGGKVISATPCGANAFEPHMFVVENQVQIGAGDMLYCIVEIFLAHIGHQQAGGTSQILSPSLG